MSAGLGTWLVTGAPPTPFAQRVLDVVALIPPGRVMTYGDVAEYLGSRAPRAVGNALAQHGHDVDWQRVVLATGDPAPSSPQEAMRLLRAERCPLTPDGLRVDLARARWEGRLPTLGPAGTGACGDSPPGSGPPGDGAHRG